MELHPVILGELVRLGRERFHRRQIGVASRESLTCRQAMIPGSLPRREGNGCLECAPCLVDTSETLQRIAKVAMGICVAGIQRQCFLVTWYRLVRAVQLMQ